MGTHSLPSGATDSTYGWGPVFRYRTDLVAAFTMATPLPEKSSSYIETNTSAPSRLTARNRGVWASPTELTFREATSITDRTCECWLATYTVRLSGETATPSGSVPTLIEARTAGRSALTSTGGVAAGDGLGELNDDGDGDGDESTGGRPAVGCGRLRSTAPNATPPPARTISAAAIATTRRQRRPMVARAAAEAAGSAAAVRKAAVTSGAPSLGRATGPSGSGASAAEPVKSAPSAMTSSGWSMTVGAMLSARCNSVAADGMRDEPPTMKIPAISSGDTWACVRTCAVNAAGRSRYGREAISNSSRLTGKMRSAIGTYRSAVSCQDSCSLATRAACHRVCRA